MTKAQEIELLQDFTNRVPRDSYLHTMLHCIIPQFTQDTRNDFPCLPNLADIEAQHHVALIQLTKTRQSLKEATQKLEETSARLQQSEARLYTVRHEASQLAHRLHFLAA